MPVFRYRAFLSYSHRDTAWAKWLHRALETYRIDKDLVGRETAHGPVPKTLRPIFRDREDFSAGHSLSEQTLSALEASEFLIVVCSPNAARSTYVNEEIRHFKALGRAARVIPVIVDGVPQDPQRECFPPALRFRLAPDGALTSEREEPIAADARPEGDGKELAKQKIVAGLLGLALDEMIRRAQRARRRRNRIRVGGAVATMLIVASAVVGWIGATSFSSQLDSTELLTIKADAADICERESDKAVAENVPEARRIAFAVKCVVVLSDGLDELSKDADVPVRLTSYLERTLVILEALSDAGKLTTEQSESVGKAGILVERLQQR
jgi:hypothetical protein